MYCKSVRETNSKITTPSTCTAGKERWSTIISTLLATTSTTITAAHTLEPSWQSLCICKHWPRYMRLSLIFPASAKVAPAVFAFLARSDPVLEVRRAARQSSVSNSMTSYIPARSTSVSWVPVQAFDMPPFGLFLISIQKKPWLRELTLLLPVPATLRSSRPFSRIIRASS